MGAIIDGCCKIDDPPPPPKPNKRTSVPIPIPVAYPKQMLSRQVVCSQKLTSVHQQVKVQMMQQPAESNPVVEEEEFYDIDSVVNESVMEKPQERIVSLRDFNICGLLGEGSFGSVLQVELKQEVSGGNTQRYAMKRIARSKLKNNKTLASIKLQRQILASLHSPFLTSLKYSFADRDNVYLVMEEAVGGDVGSLVRYGKRKQEFLKMGEQAVQFIGGSVVLGLEYLHAQHILYRDLKAENILLFADGYAKLSDFGLAKLVVEDEIHKTQAGTALYNAPEMVMRVGYNKCVDFWALGVLFYELATGETPFKLEDVSTKIRFKRIAMEQERTHKWRGLPISRELQSLVGGLLRFNPEERLGVRGWSEIKSHPFFIQFDWKALQQKTMKSPLLSLLQRYPREIKYFKPVENLVQGHNDSGTVSDEQFWDYNYKKQDKMKRLSSQQPLEEYIISQVAEK